MPCRSDYMEPNQWELEGSKVLALLEEIAHGTLPDWYGNGSDHHVYMRMTQKLLDEATAVLCGNLKKLDVSKFSLEMQMWWKDHQIADAKRRE